MIVFLYSNHHMFLVGTAHLHIRHSNAYTSSIALQELTNAVVHPLPHFHTVLQQEVFLDTLLIPCSEVHILQVFYSAFLSSPFLPFLNHLPRTCTGQSKQVHLMITAFVMVTELSPPLLAIHNSTKYQYRGPVLDVPECSATCSCG